MHAPGVSGYAAGIAQDAASEAGVLHDRIRVLGDEMLAIAMATTRTPSTTITNYTP